MTRHGYCLKKDIGIDDRKVVDYCLGAGDFKSVCKNFAFLEVSNGVEKVVHLKVRSQGGR